MLYKTLLSLVVISLPGMAHAQIYSHTTASSNSGGNTVGAGGTVTTGNAVSSVQVSNTGSQGTSSSSIYIRTEANGVVHEETIHSDNTHADVSVETTPKGTQIEVREGTPPKVVRQEFISATTSPSTTQSEAATSTEAPAAGLGAQIVLTVQSFFAAVFNWFK